MKKRKIPEDFSASFAAMLQDAIQFDRDEREQNRVRALEYLRGYMTDTPHEPGKSQATTSELGDVVGWIMPGLIRIFAGAGQVVEYQPTKPADEEQADQASDYVSHVFANECDGYKVLYQSFHDALVTRNGVVKYWWDDTVLGKHETLQNLSEDQLVLLAQDDTINVVGHSEGDTPGTITIKIQRIEREGSLKVEAIPPEDFIISRRARSEADSPLVGHRSLMTRSDLVKMGFDKDLIYGLPVSDAIDRETSDIARGRLDSLADENVVEALQTLETFECYTYHDMDDDGIAEMIKVFAVGDSSHPEILDWEEWADEAPFASFVPGIVPHSWQGRSVADDVMDYQRISTTLMRQTLDNLYLSNQPQRYADVSRIVDPDELLSPVAGGVVRVKSGDPRTAIVDQALPFTAAASLEVMRFIQQVLQARTGTSQSAAVIDEGALVPTTATEKQIEHDASFSRVELIARNFAEIGMKRLFRGILRLIVKNQDRPRTLMLRGKWVDFDPRAWNAEMGVTINVGLGTGTKERDVAMLRAIGAEQDKIVAQLGPDNPIVTPSMYVKTRLDMVSAAGVQNPEQYFKSIEDTEFRQFLDWKSKQQQPAVDPLKQATIELQAEKNKMDFQLGVMQIEHKKEEMAVKSEIENKRSAEEILRSDAEMRQEAERDSRDRLADIIENMQANAGQSVAPEGPSLLDQMKAAKIEQEMRHAEEMHAVKLKAAESSVAESSTESNGESQ